MATFDDNLIEAYAYTLGYPPDEPQEPDLFEQFVRQWMVGACRAHHVQQTTEKAQLESTEEFNTKGMAIFPELKAKRRAEKKEREKKAKEEAKLMAEASKDSEITF